jgi:3-dehydroquinate dehydratase/shikimate dehydrogenase
MVHDLASALSDAQAAKDTGADLVEFRIDEVFSGSGDQDEEKRIIRLVSDSPLPCIVTCRPVSEGGHYDGDDMARVALLERLGTASGQGEHPPRFIDVELETMARSANLRQKIKLAIDHPEQIRDLKTSLILSTHDFRERPRDLTRRVLRMREHGEARVLKIAYRVRSVRDNLELFDLLSERDRPMIALGMGEPGLMSRVLAPKFGGFLTFASLRPQTATAPGQPTVRELLDLYRFRSIGPATRVYGVVGWPVGHSMSPAVHNAGFEAVGWDGVYLPLPVAGGEERENGGAEERKSGSEAEAGVRGEDGFVSFKATVLELIDYAGLDFCGCSVTLPHKENLVRLAREKGWEIDPLAERCGAGNTLVVERAGIGAGVVRARVFSSDATAAVACLSEAMGQIAGRRVAIIGAGGVARAVAAGLLEADANVVVFNRSRARGERLVTEFRAAFTKAPERIVAEDLTALSASRCHAYVNCTPVGMKGGSAPQELAVPVAQLKACEAGAVFFDTVYNPVETPMLKAAREAGFRVVDGVQMFVRQAAEQFQAWTGSAAPVGLFDRVARESVGG